MSRTQRMDELASVAGISHETRTRRLAGRFLGPGLPSGVRSLYEAVGYRRDGLEDSSPEPGFPADSAFRNAARSSRSFAQCLTIMPSIGRMSTLMTLAKNVSAVDVIVIRTSVRGAAPVGCAGAVTANPSGTGSRRRRRR